MLTGLSKFSGQAVRSRASSPKLQVLNNALLTAQSGLTPTEARAATEFWGHLTESAVGAHLANAAASGLCELFYWRESNREVDFVLRAGRVVVGLEVKSGRGSLAHSGLAAFRDAFRPKRTLLVGGDGIPLEEFLSRPVTDWL